MAQEDWLDKKEVENVLREIAFKHGIKLGKDDPYMLTIEINYYLYNQVSHLLDNFKDQIEEVIKHQIGAFTQTIDTISENNVHQFKQDVQTSLEQALQPLHQIANQASQEVQNMTQKAIKELQSSVEASKNVIANELDNSVAQRMKEAKIASYMALAASAIAMAAAFLLLLFR